MKRLAWILVLVLIMTMTGSVGSQVAQASTCTSLTGPGLPPPASVPSGIPGFHAAWYGQSGYPTLCPGATATSVVAYYNSGSLGWVRGEMGQVAYLGTWNPIPGQDRPSVLGGDGTNGSPNTGWPRYNRIAIQPASYVGPGQVAWFQFTIQAPTTPGYYQLYLRPLIEGSSWLEDYGVYWLVTVLQPDGIYPTPLPAAAGCRNWPDELGTELTKLPRRLDNCLLPYDARPATPYCQSPYTGCYLVFYPSVGMAATWVMQQSSLSEVFATAHEVCHSHQDWVVGQENPPNPSHLGPLAIWPVTSEGQAFAKAWSAYSKASGTHPFPDRGSLEEDFGDVCAAWYYPLSEEITSNFPDLASFANQWLPK